MLLPEINIVNPQSETIFHYREGLPIQLSVQSYAIITSICKHHINHHFTIQTESTVEWTIKDGLKNGAFKIGHSTNSNYVSKDNGNCVIYYPPSQGFGNNTEKEVLIFIKISADDNNNNNNKGNNSNTNKFILKLNLQKTNKGKKWNFYKAKLNLESNNNESISQDKGDKKESTYNIQDNFSKSLVSKSNELPICKECEINVKSDSRRETNDIQINISKCLMTSEYVKISSTIMDSKLTDLFLVGNGYRRTKIDEISSSPVDLIWDYTAGLMVDNKGKSVIYYTPGGRELSKSPVVLTLYGENQSIDKNERAKIVFDKRKIWLLRRSTCCCGII